MIPDPLLERTRREGPRRAIVDAGAGFWASWYDVDGLATAWARQLQRLGVEPGRRIAVREPAGVRFASLLHACWRAGFAFVPVPMRATASEIERLLADARPRVLIEDGEARLLDGAAEPEPGDVAIVYTSGTTGPPKGVRLTGENLVASALGCQESLGAGSGDRWLLCLQGHHVGGLSILVRAAVSGQTAVTLARFDEGAVAEAIAREGCTLVSLVPTMLERLLSAGQLGVLRGVRAVLLGGAPASAGRVAEWAASGIPVCPTYGLSETGSQVATVPPGRAAELAGTAGFVHSRARVEIHAGELWVGGDVLSPGYVNPALDRRPEPGWFATGDAGHFDERGALVITGRRDDAIITGGENVHPEEVEDVLRSHPAVLDAAVVGLPDPTWGSLLEARLVVKGELDAAALEAFARSRLSSFKVPRRYVAVPSLPRSQGGKLIRRDLLGPQGPARASS